MADNNLESTTDTNIGTETTGSSFLNESSEAAKTEDSLYNDFFQENGNEEMTLSAKKERSGLEVLVNVLEYITMLVVVSGVLAGLHVFVRSMENTTFLETYPFLCPYLNYDIEIPKEEKGCKNVNAIQKEYLDKKQVLENNIIDALVEYIPIKVSSSILDASPEKKFVLTTFENKPHVNNVLEAFERVKAFSQKNVGNGEKNIKCVGVTVTNGDTLSTQCTVYGGSIGNMNTNGQLGSSRLEALDFLEKLADTTRSSLVLNNYTTSLSIENISDKEAETLGYNTRTTIPINVRYIPLTVKN
ncbi:hypothetical protein K2X92_03130 [Candidatus Gracilibacteria bacterium]|nr:hypothetical protein [Candidatus Gracilibacteria bacterium]